MIELDASEETPPHEISEAEIEENLEESFPASDPPSWTLGHEAHPSGDTEKS